MRDHLTLTTIIFQSPFSSNISRQHDLLNLMCSAGRKCKVRAGFLPLNPILTYRTFYGDSDLIVKWQEFNSSFQSYTKNSVFQ